jgi:hypothetical protein
LRKLPFRTSLLPDGRQKQFPHPFANPVLVGEDGEIIAGHGRVEAAKLIGLEQVPTVRMLLEKRPQRTHACRTARDRGAFARDRVR